jgi:squalene-hopene/tetraprenyl-beta-curcumene cyclase
MDESFPRSSANISTPSSSHSSNQTSAQTPASAPQMRFGKIDDLGSRVAVAVDAARKYLFSQQHEDGYWCGELEADTTLESDYILLHTLLGTSNQ